MGFYDFSATDINGCTVSMGDYRAKVVLIVNTASKCGFTGQYEGLEKLYRKHHDRGLVILGFPCNQFLKQEPGDEQEIKEFCRLNYDVTFPLFSKIDVNGKNTHPLYRFLRDTVPGRIRGKAIKWNFAKFLIDRTGEIIKRYAPTDTPEALEADIIKMLESS